MEVKKMTSSVCPSAHPRTLRPGRGARGQGVTGLVSLVITHKLTTHTVSTHG